jgi:hypothetical protein
MQAQQSSGASNPRSRMASDSGDHELTLAATKAWARATMHFTGLSASAASKRFSPPESVPGSNSKRFYGLARGEHVIQAGPHGRYGYDLLSDVNRHPRGKYATRYYLHPWKLLRVDITLDQVCDVLYGLDPRLAKALFYAPFSGLKNQRGWLRKSTDMEFEMKTLGDLLVPRSKGLERGVSMRWEHVFDLFIALWCLYREAELQRNIGRVIFFQEAIAEVQKEIAYHPVFQYVFDDYQKIVRRLEAGERSLLVRARRAQWHQDHRISGKPTCVCFFDSRDSMFKVEYHE